jgi:hypothetical protein
MGLLVEAPHCAQAAAITPRHLSTGPTSASTRRPKKVVKAAWKNVGHSPSMQWTIGR